MKHLLSVARRLAMPLTLAACGMTGLQAQTAKLPVQLGVASYNIHHGEGTDGKFDYYRLAKQLERWQPDVIALQEVDSMTTRSGKTYALGALAEITRYYETFCPAMDYQGGKYGIGLLSRQKPLKVKSYALPGKEEPRRLVVAEFKDYAVACTHLSLNAEERMASLPVILEAARSTDKPFILAGDWNDTPDSPFIKAMAKEFDFCSSTQQATYPSDTPKDCIDYIAIYKRGREKTGPKQVWEGPFINEPAVVTSRTVGTDKVASDHRAIFAHFALPTPVSKLMTTPPYLQLATPTSVNVMFQTNSVCHCWVEFGTDSLHTQRARTILDGQEVCYDIENNILLKDLKPGTRYFYRVCAQELLLKRAYENHFGGDTLRTKFYSFTTPGIENDDQFVCAIFNDLHESKETYDTLRQLMEQEGINPDFVIFNGDCLPEPTNREHALRMIPPWPTPSMVLNAPSSSCAATMKSATTIRLECTTKSAITTTRPTPPSRAGTRASCCSTAERISPTTLAYMLASTTSPNCVSTRSHFSRRNSRAKISNRPNTTCSSATSPSSETLTITAHALTSGARCSKKRPSTWPSAHTRTAPPFIPKAPMAANSPFTSAAVRQ